MKQQVMIVAAEASSVTYAERLLQHWKKIGRDVQAFGVGSQAMENLGFERLGKSEEMAVVGIAEVISHYGHLKAVFNKLVEEATKRRPQVVIVLDYPDFNLMLAKKMKELGIPVVYYISPQVWAWRQGRVKKIKEYCDKVFVLFPFEEKFYEKHNVPCEFVGHPLLDEIDDKLFDPQYFKSHRNQCGIQDNEFVLGLMPGSRRKELESNFETQLEVARRLSRKYENFKVLILVAPTFSKEQIQEKLENFMIPYILIKDEPFRMIHLCDAMLVASGTATLQVGLMQKPMVIMYKVNWLTGVIGKMLVKGVRFLGLANLILNEEVVPERFQSDANPEELTKLIEKYIREPEYYATVQKNLARLRSQLGDKGATVRVANALERYFQK